MDSVLEQVISGKNLPYDQIDQWIEDEEFQEIERFAQALAEAWDDRPSERWRYSGSYGRVVDGLALVRGEKHIETLFAVLVHRSHDDKLIRRVAAQLASTQLAEVLDKFAKLTALTNLWACLIQELVIEGVAISSYKNLSQVAHMMREQQHPLGLMPLNLVAAEAEIRDYRRRYKNGGSSVSLPFGSVANGQDKTGLPDKVSGIMLEETTTPDLRTRLESAFENWTRESNGRIEAKQFSAQNALTTHMLTDTRLLLDLKLECLEGVAASEVNVWQMSSKQVLNSLFAAAANGGAYNSGLGNAYGRLHAWKSAAALINEPEAIPITTLNEALGNVQWFQMVASSSWFHRVAWDDAIIALSGDGRTLTILAATDTD